MDRTLRWFAGYLHDKHRIKSGVNDWADCDYYPCLQLQQAVLKGIPAPYEETEGAGTY